MGKWISNNRAFLCGLMLIFVVRGSFADQNYVPSGSMEPTIQVGDFLFVNKMAYDLKLPWTSVRVASVGEVQRGDVVVFINPVSGVRMVKRIVGLPGDHLRVVDGRVLVNGELLKEPYVLRQAALFRPDACEVIVPRGKYFAMGDNRDNSLDSRAWGFVPRENIEGRADGVIYNLVFEWPPRMDFGRIGHPFSKSS